MKTFQAFEACQFLSTFLSFLVISCPAVSAYNKDGGTNDDNLTPQTAEFEHDNTLYIRNIYKYNEFDTWKRCSCNAKETQSPSGGKAATVSPRSKAALLKRGMPKMDTEVPMDAIGTQAFPGTIGTEGLNGCTAVILIGTHGVALGHFVWPGLKEIEDIHKKYITAGLNKGSPTLYLIMGYDIVRQEYPMRIAMQLAEQAGEYLGVVAHVKHYSWARDDFTQSHFVHVDSLGKVQVGSDYA